MARFCEHAQKYYRYPDGRATSEVASLKTVVQAVLDIYPDLLCSAFGPKALKVVRQHMIGKKWCRKHINKQVGRIRLIFRWGTEEEHVPAGVLEALKAVQGLQCGRRDAPEREPVRPAGDELINAIRPYVSPTVWDMVQTQLLCGGRAQDLTQLRPAYIDRSKDVWEAIMPQHKTAWCGHTHKLLLGPRAQAILAPYLLRRPAHLPVFSPRESTAEGLEKRAAARTTSLSCGNRPGTNVKADPRRQPGDEFDVTAYCRAITRACELALPVPDELARGRGPTGRPETMKAWAARLGPDKWSEAKRWRRDHRFKPLQLRHTAAPEIRHRCGPDVPRSQARIRRHGNLRRGTRAEGGTCRPTSGLKLTPVPRVVRRRRRDATLGRTWKTQLPS